MRLVILTQVLDRQDAVLGFFHGWCAVFARHVDQLVVIAQKVGEVDLPGVEVHDLGKADGAGRLVMAARMNRLLLQGPKADAVWAHMVPRFVLSVLPAARLRRLPLWLWYTHKGVDRSLRLACRCVRGVFSASEESFRHDGARHLLQVTGHGIDGEQFAPGDEPRPVDVLAVGRLAPSKGQDELLDALERLPAMPVTELAGDILLESDRPFAEALAARAARHDGRVTLLGAVPHVAIAGTMGRARLLVNTSYTGSVDKVVLEAMACGTIPVTCNESFERVLGPELAPRLMVPQGDPAALAERVAELLALPDDERLVLGARLREIVLADHDLARLIPTMVERMAGGGAR